MRQLHSVSTAKSICYLAIKINGHNVNYNCHCFSCRICQVLLSTLFARGHQKLLLVVKKSNYYNISEQSIYQKRNSFFLVAKKSGCRILFRSDCDLKAPVLFIYFVTKFMSYQIAAMANAKSVFLLMYLG